MKNLAILIFLFLLISFSFTAFAQKPKTNSIKKTVLATPTKSTKTPGGEKTEFEKAVNQTSAADRTVALHKFVKNFPN